jgi:hypothetical protein
MKILAFAGALLCGLLLPAALAGDAPAADKEVDPSKVYSGDPNHFDNPAVLRIAKVFEAIPEYRDAKKRDKDDPEYYILLEKANLKFFAALDKVVSENRYDLVAEAGSVKVKGKEIPDVTAAVIKALSR